MVSIDKLLPIQLEPGKSIQNQIRQMLVSWIISGRIPGGFRMPSSRKLARDLKVSRNTVVFVYEGLVQDGYLISRERQGFFVSEERDAKLQTDSEPQIPDTEAAHEPNWARRFCVRPTTQRNIDKPGNWWSYHYPFIYGQVDPELFPISSWRDCSRQAMGRGELSAWTTDAQTVDDPLLIQQIRETLLPRRGIYVGEDEILVTLGAQNAIYLSANILMGKDSVVGMEEPGYSDSRNIFNLLTDQIKFIEVDKDGIAVDERLADCDYVYVTPSHQYPTTATMPLERRLALIEMATKSRLMIIEDDYESETNYVENPTAALKSLDTENRVVYVGSLSKSLFPGLRLGYLVGPPGFIAEARALRRLVLRHPPTIAQRTTALFMGLGYHNSLMRQLHNVFAQRWREMDDALRTYLPEWPCIPGYGGTAYWLEGPPDFDADKLAEEALKESVIIEPGKMFYGGPNPLSNYFRLGFSSVPVERIKPGIETLASCINRLL